MRNLITLLAVFFLLGIFAIQAVAQDGMVTVNSQYSVEETVDRLENTLTNNGLNIFKKVDHRDGAASVDMQLQPTTVVIFGNPKLGTPLMQCAPTVAIDLPQKMLIWKDGNGNVSIGYNSPEYLKKRHNITGCDQELQKVNAALQKFAEAAAGIT